MIGKYDLMSSNREFFHWCINQCLGYTIQAPATSVEDERMHGGWKILHELPKFAKKPTFY